MSIILFKIAEILLFASVAIAFTGGFINLVIDFWKILR